MIVATLCIASLVLIGAGQALAQEPPGAEVVAKNLAQNVLGEGTVRWVRVSSGGHEIDIAWDAVLYRAAHTTARNREQLRGEAELATGSIMGVMKPVVVRYNILLGERTIAQGRRTRDGFTITYARDLGG
ncbi:MAG TPA: hypothetical protein VFT63_08215 [bacterium]|nr:hypothetical protein [bacterium]